VINTTAITIMKHTLHNLHPFSTVKSINSVLFSQHKHQTGFESICKNNTKLNYLRGAVRMKCFYFFVLLNSSFMGKTTVLVKSLEFSIIF